MGIMDKKEYLKRLKLLLLLSTVIFNKRIVNAEEVSTDIKKIGEPKYYNDLYSSFTGMGDEWLEFFKDNNCYLTILEGENDAEVMYQQITGKNLSGSILGFTTENYSYTRNAYVEGCNHSGRYEKYSDSSAGLTIEEFNKRIDISTMFHELGHLVDYIEGISSSDDFINIYNEEVNNFQLTEEYSVNCFKIHTNIENTEEYFATAFSSYMSNKEDLLNLCPKTYDVIRNKEEEIKDKYVLKKDK